MIEEVWSRARRASGIDRLIIATDDERIRETAARFGAETMMTSTSHLSGTDRVAEVVLAVDERYEVILNIQGDEPLLTPTSLDLLISAFDVDPMPEMATLAEPIESESELFNPNVVKLVVDDEGRALYFSRSPIPYFRDRNGGMQTDFRQALPGRPDGLVGYRKHQGIYGYRRDSLLALTKRKPSQLERDESLEQLRALQAGFLIRVVDSDFRSMAVDEPEDLDRVVKVLMEID
jgi:3-deoxy-manno-octulosonate cytidylyltransferase (CMP-KDO synthetase)